MTKTAAVTDVDHDGRTDLGDTITWSFLVSDTGTTTVHSVAIDDPAAGAVSCPVTTLARGASTTCVSAPYVIDQADVDAGVVSNTATATAADPEGHPIVSAPSSADTPVDQVAGLVVTKSAAVLDQDGDRQTDLGDQVTWSFLVRDSGTTTIHAVAVNDPTAGSVTCPVTTLAPGATTLCAADTPHTVSQADVDAGDVSNTATATALDPAGASWVSAPSSTDTAVTQRPALALTKTASVTDVDGDGHTDLGDTITWSLLVKNTGTTTLSGVGVSDPLAGPIDCPATALAPGATTACSSAAYTIGQADVDAGLVSNTATAQATAPDGDPVDSPQASADTAIQQAPALQLVKSATVTDVGGDGKTDLGDTVAWSFAVSNPGTTTIHGMVIDDPAAGPVSCPVASLAPGTSTTCTSSAHVVSQADVDAGVVSNTATAAGRAPGGSAIVSAPSSADTPVAQFAALSAQKHAVVNDLNHDGRTDLGDTITWSVTVSDTGTVSVSSVAIDDPKGGPMTCAATALAPGASTVCTATLPYAISQPDVDAGRVDNTATASATDPQGAPVMSAEASVTTPVAAVSALSLIKQAALFDTDGDGVPGLGDTISWTFHVSNTGSTTLGSLAIDDPIAGAVTCPVTTLAPGAQTNCTATAPHVVTQADVDSGDVSNTAVADAVGPGGAAVSSLPSSTDTQLDQLTQLRLVKHGTATDVNHDGLTDAGDTIIWSFDVTNIGRVTINGVSVSDARAGPVTCAATALLPGAATTCMSSQPYVITTADAKAGAVHNVATATGDCGCKASVKAVKAAAVVATKKTVAPATSSHPTTPSHPTKPTAPGHPSTAGDPADPTAARDAPVVPGLPFTGAMGVVWAVRAGLAALGAGFFLIVVARRRRDEDEDEPSAV